MANPETNPLNRKGPIWTILGVSLVAGILATLIIRASIPVEAPEKTPEPATPRHLILISIDTLRADHLGCYGHAAAQTPVIDKLASDGALFERHYTCYPLTLPSHLTQLTGVSSLGHRVRDNLYHRLPEQFATLPEELGKSGFACGAFVSAFTMRSGSGVERGFSVYDDEGVRELPQGRLTIPERKADETLKRAGDWCEQHKEKQRLFCFIHLFDPHAPYQPPADLAARFEGKPNGAYDGEIAYTDRELGKFFERLKALKLFENALVVITADHGEGLGEHNELSHGHYCYDATTHIPLIISGGAIKKGTRPAAITRNYDLTPTLLDLLNSPNASLSKQAHGTSLKPLLDDPAKDLGLSCYIESHYAFLNANWAKIRALRTKDGLTIFSGNFVEHYSDAEQQVNVASAESAQAAKARDEIVRLLTSLKPPRSGRQKPGGSAIVGSPYPGEAATEQNFEPESIHDTNDLPAPAHNGPLLRRYQEAELAYDDQRFDTCRDLLLKLIADAPKFLMAHKLLAGVNQLRVQSEWKKLGVERAKELSKEAALSLATGMEISNEAQNTENSQRMRLNAALLAVWTNDHELMKRLAKSVEATELNFFWLEYVLLYRLADADSRPGIVEGAAKWLDSAKGKLAETVKADATKDLGKMHRGEPLKLAPWE